MIDAGKEAPPDGLRAHRRTGLNTDGTILVTYFVPTRVLAVDKQISTPQCEVAPRRDFIELFRVQDRVLRVVGITERGVAFAGMPRAR